MNHGKNTCNQLKAIRKRIAEANEIEYNPHECTFEGECRGTCPACESEMRYIENELFKRKSLGKKIAMVGLAVGLSATQAMAQEPEALEGDVSPQDEEIITDEEEVAEEPLLGFIIEQLPEFPGGEMAFRKYIADNIKYPKEAVYEGFQGTVYVSFVVDTVGNTTNVKVLRGVHPLLDAEAVRVIKSIPQKWKPAMQGRKKMEFNSAVPVKFVLPDDKK